MPEEFLLSYISFDENNQPFIDAETNGDISRLPILGEKLNLEFDFSEKYCTGYVDFEKRCSVACPEKELVDTKYENCMKCRDRTGFNPAFYHASSISEQQEKINQQPHFVYLAYFAPDAIKVGISQEARGLRRVLEQGARIAIKIETFGSALVARQYEERIANQPAVIENITGRKKLQLLKEPFDMSSATKLLEAKKAEIESALGVEFKSAELIEADKFFATTPVDTEKAIDMTDTKDVVGEVVASIGAIIVTKYQDDLLLYNLKRYVGYRAKTLDQEIEIELPSEQLTLF